MWRRSCVALATPAPIPSPTRGRERTEFAEENSATTACPTRSLLELTLAGAVVAVLPDHPLAVLGDELGDQGDGVLPVIIERDRPHDGVIIDHVGQGIDHLLAVRPDLLDLVKHELHGDERERAVSFRRLLVAGLVVLLLEIFAARQLLDRCALDEAERAFRQR